MPKHDHTEGAGVPFDIYCRISQEGDRTAEEVAEQLEIYEATCREWAERNGIEPGEVVHETNVSGSAAVADRQLGGLIKRVESGESAGILTPYLDRFGRDQLEGCIAWKRIADADGRLVCVMDGIDSAAEGAKLVFQMRMAIAEDYLDRVKSNFQSRRVRAAERGVHLGGQPPVGYWKDWENGGRLMRHTALSALVVQTFERRAKGETFASLARWLLEEGGEIEVPNPKHPKRLTANDPETVRPLAGVTENGVRHMIGNTAYLGEAERPRKAGEPPEINRDGTPKSTTTIRNAHEPIVSAHQWEAAPAAGGPWSSRNNGRWSSQVRLAGLVYCKSGHRLKTGGGGSGKYKHPIYTCTHPDCKTRATVGAERLDNWVENLITDAVYAGEPHVVAVLEGDDRYARALEAVEQARRELDTYRSEISVSLVGAEQWRRDVQVRTAALEAARAALKVVPTTRKAYSGKPPVSARHWAEAGKDERTKIIEAAMGKDRLARMVARVVVKPVGQGSRVPVSERAEMWLVGAEAALDPATVTTLGDPEVVAILAAAHAV